MVKCPLSSSIMIGPLLHNDHVTQTKAGGWNHPDTVPDALGESKPPGSQATAVVTSLSAPRPVIPS